MYMYTIYMYMKYILAVCYIIMNIELEYEIHILQTYINKTFISDIHAEIHIYHPSIQFTLWDGLQMLENCLDCLYIGIGR